MLVDDQGSERDDRPAKPCCVRLLAGGWCALDDGHELPHVGPEVRELAKNNFGPRSKKP